MRPRDLVETARRRGLGRLAITDHSQISGALEAHAIDPDLIVVGEEVYTTEGEILAYYVHELVPRGLEPMEAIQRLRDQGAVISVPHPVDPLRGGSWDMEPLQAILPHVDALEVFNARSYSDEPNRQAAQLAESAGLLTTAGTDSHAHLEVGRAGLELPPFEDPDSMRTALRVARVFGCRSSPLVHFLSRWAALRKSLRLGRDHPFEEQA